MTQINGVRKAPPTITGVSMKETVTRIAASVAIACSITLAGCAGPGFTVQRADDRFTTNKNPVYISENNRVSTKSLTGGIHIDDQGVFVNPFVEQEPSGKAKALGFMLVNRTSVSTWVGNKMRFGDLQQIVFRLDNGELITLAVTQPETATSGLASYNPIGRYADMPMVESGKAAISQSDYNKLASAQSVSVKITGSAQSFVYEEKDVVPSFLNNLRLFQEQHIR